MEIFDVVNENDEVVSTAPREECHANPDLIHRTVHFSLIDKKNKKVLMTQRSFSKKTDPGKLCFLGEHMLSGESWQEGLIRGAKEELSFNAKDFVELANNIFRFPNETEFVRFFLINWSGEKLDYDKDEIIKIDWVNFEDLIASKSNYSNMTQYWVDNVSWESIQ